MTHYYTKNQKDAADNNSIMLRYIEILMSYKCHKSTVVACNIPKYFFLDRLYKRKNKTPLLFSFPL